MNVKRTVIAFLLVAIMIAGAIPAGKLAAFGYGDPSNVPLPIIIAYWFQNLYTTLAPDASYDDNEIVNIPNYAAERRKQAANNKTNSKTCVKEGKTSDIMERQECCAGLKEITVHDDTGLAHMCVSASGQKAGGICTFDDDCKSGMKCLSFDVEPRVCVDIGKQKEGASCRFDDECATGYFCSWDAGSRDQCQKAPACAKAGERLDESNHQKCCGGLKQISIHNDEGFGYECVAINNTGENQTCTFDDDCKQGYFCYQASQCRKQPACAGQGDVVDFSNGQECCTGLDWVMNYNSKNGALVLPVAAQQVCIKCGDGICGKGENGTNCSKDCSGVALPAADGAGKYIESTPMLGKVMLKPGQCQEINCVGDLRNINNDYKCNGKVIARIVCVGEDESRFSGYGSAGGYSSNQLCCNQNGGISESGTNGTPMGGTTANIKIEPLDVIAINDCAKEGEALIFLSNQECCSGLRSILTKKDGNPVDLCIQDGSQKAGQPCSDDEDCQSGLDCDRGSFSDPVCVRK